MLALARPAVSHFRFQDISPSVTTSKMLYAGLPSPIRVPQLVMNQLFTKMCAAVKGSRLTSCKNDSMQVTTGKRSLFNKGARHPLITVNRMEVPWLSSSFGLQSCQVRFLHALQLKLQAGPVGDDAKSMVFWGTDINDADHDGLIFLLGTYSYHSYHIQLNQVS